MARADRVILFHPDLIPLIRSGTETLTYRLDDDGLDYLAVGDRVKAEHSSTGKPFAELEVTSMDFTTFGELPIDRKGHVKYSSKEEQRTVFKGYYGRDVEDGERALILCFQVMRWLGEFWFHSWQMLRRADWAVCCLGRLFYTPAPPVPRPAV